ncbi:MAG: hypothetical protein FJ045_05525, partial [Crenarchaeota archaeon]|nr:hypothetical protein [Thermoproteota archaeon]
MQTMNRSILTWVTLGVLLFLPPVIRAEIVKGKGQGEIVYKGMFKQGSADERAAITEAKKNALTRFAATFDTARFELYKKIESEVLGSIDQY